MITCSTRRSYHTANTSAPANETAQSLINQFRELVLSCRYYTGATVYLRDRAAALGAVSYQIPNGLNTTQIALSRISLQEIAQTQSRSHLKLGYFSGTLTHQSDFGLIAFVLLRLMVEFPTLCLVVAGEFNMAEFPELSSHSPTVSSNARSWTGRGFPPRSRRADINLIPLIMSPFTEAKSDLKYYEAAVLKVPSVASPTAVFSACITHGSNGFLAPCPDDWHTSLRTDRRSGPSPLHR